MPQWQKIFQTASEVKLNSQFIYTYLILHVTMTELIHSN